MEFNQPSEVVDETAPLLVMRNITRRFPGVVALSGVDLDIRRGEVHILLGENGAGKSTLIKILSGVYRPDSGQVLFRGQEVHFDHPGEAQRAGIAVIYQEPRLIPSMTVAENIYLGNEPSGALFASIDENRIIDGTQELIDRLNLSLDPLAPVSELSLAEQQVVAIARALHLAADLVIMDEPTAMFSQHEVAQLFAAIRSLRAQGVGVLYVTHRLEEAMHLGDRTTILRDGRKIATLNIHETNEAELVWLIVGRNIAERVTRLATPPGEEILRLEKVCAVNGIQDISFALHSGEILGITGLVGAGGTSILRAIFGADRLTSGGIFLDGEAVRIDAPQDAIALGIGMLTEDRQQQGLVLEMNGQENVTLASLDRIGPGPWIDLDAEQNIVQHYTRRLSIRDDDLERKALFLSGGTQQKLVLSRWLASRCRVLLLDEPTRGIDVGARLELYRLMNELSRRGLGMVMVSSNLQEIFNMSDRIAVVRQGRLAAILPRTETTPAEILTLASGA